MKRQLINTAAPLLKICGICAAMNFAFVANSAQAQTMMCPAGQENVRGICQNVCSEGQTRITSSRVLEERQTGCFDNALISILDDCEDAGWAGREATGVPFGGGTLGCEIPSVLIRGAARDRRSAGDLCYIVQGGGGTISPITCAAMYGNPPVFPKKADHPDVRAGNSASAFIANCDPDGAVPGGYPPNHNLNGETECTCNRASHIGTWPNCTAFPTGLTPAEREGIHTCADQGWTISTATAFFKCDIPLISGEETFDECFFGPGTPQCADVFGATELAFPKKEDSVRYVFDCGEGMIPAGANLNGATECIRQPYLQLRLRLFLEGPLR